MKKSVKIVLAGFIAITCMCILTGTLNINVNVSFNNPGAQAEINKYRITDYESSELSIATDEHNYPFINSDRNPGWLYQSKLLGAILIRLGRMENKLDNIETMLKR